MAKRAVKKKSIAGGGRNSPKPKAAAKPLSKKIAAPKKKTARQKTVKTEKPRKAKKASTTPPKTPRPGAPPGNRGGILGEVAWLMARSPQHRHLFMADLDWLVFPPMRLGQCRLLRNGNGDPLAFASWALVSEEVEKRLQKKQKRLKPDEWFSGDQLWLIDVVAPEGAVPQVLAELQKSVFKGKRVRTMLPVGGGRKMTVSKKLSASNRKNTK